ncbi:MAG: hypothetical protein EA417_21775 [Gammaproteobacteria bacterium]|nr:MAG: hypothetical protein EA417_21775 [Gammaproteobacteria bacterium]
MWIRRLEVEHWRGLEHVLLDDLSPHLNLVTGPNESGKSRVAQALRFGLFESSRGAGRFKQDLQTWGGSERPRVRVDFELAGAAWQVEKTFVSQQHQTRLSTANRAFEGEEAEARLRELLGTEPGSTTSPASGAQLGRWSLLWVEQGRAGEEPEVADNSAIQGGLHDRLVREVGDVAAGALGQYVRRRAREEAERFYSQGLGAEKKRLKEARSHLEACSAEREDIERRIAAIEDDARTLRRTRMDESDLSERRAVAEAERGDARKRRDDTRELARQLEAVTDELTRAEAAVAERRKALGRAEALAEELGTNEQRREQLQAELDAAVREEAETSSALAELRENVVNAETALDELRTERLRLQRLAQARSQREELARLDARLEEAARQDTVLAELRTALNELPEVAEADVMALRKLEREQVEASARLEGASVRVRLQTQRELDLDGERIEAGVERTFLVDRDRSFDLDGVATVEIQPGSGALESLRDAVADRKADLRRRIEALGVKDLEHAERVRREREALVSREREARHRLRELFPDGREAARSWRDELAAALAELSQSEVPPDLDAALANIETDEGEQNARAKAARDRRDEISARAEALARRVADLRSELKGIDGEVAQLKRQLEGDGSVARVQEACDAAARTLADVVARRDDIAEVFKAAGGDTAELDLQRAEQAVAALVEQAGEKRDLRVALEQRMNDAGASSLHEALQDAASAGAAAELDLARLEREAGAARRLFERVEQAYGAAQAQLAEPVIRRIQPYLEQVLPGARAHLADDFALLGLQQGEAGSTERFDQLSGGTREQLALLVRIGLAEVLGEDEPWPLLLDDALVNTDPERIRQFQRVLFAASRRTQILFFTCHGPLFDATGADRVVPLEPRPRRH